MVAAMNSVGVDGAIMVSSFSAYEYDPSYALEVYRNTSSCIVTCTEMAGISASSLLLRVAATVRSLIPLRTLRAVDGAGSPCPIAVIAQSPSHPTTYPDESARARPTKVTVLYQEPSAAVGIDGQIPLILGVSQ